MQPYDSYRKGKGCGVVGLCGGVGVCVSGERGVGVELRQMTEFQNSLKSMLRSLLQPHVQHMFGKACANQRETQMRIQNSICFCKLEMPSP